MSAPNRSGIIRFNDASLSIWEEPAKVEPVWEQQFKRDVFARIVQQLNRIGWTCVVPDDMVKQYSVRFARKYRYCRKGDLEAQLSISGRCITLDMWQNVANVENRNGGKYDFDKEARMPYLLRLEMERTRRRLRRYLCNIFGGYRFEPGRPERGPNGLTALQWVEQDVRRCWHYDENTGRRAGEGRPYNNKSAEGLQVVHGSRVWFADPKGRMLTGTAYYNINNMWWVISGRYGLWNVASFEIYTLQPGDLRTKRNAALRRDRLKRQLDAAVKTMSFERAAVLRDILHPAADRVEAVAP